MSRGWCGLLGGVLLLAASVGAAQTLTTYTEADSGQGRVALGYPVPTPVASLTPVDGFRDYASLQARLQSLALASDELAAEVVGQTDHGRDLWAYVVGSPGPADIEGRAKAAFFINATTHAREWAAPEVATGLVERMVDGANDAGLVRYLLDNTRLVIIPVHNIDGLLQTQRHPAEALIGQDPCSPSTWPRDGRMRRKNMNGADELLATLGDHLAGIDLNRNHPPFWTTSMSTTRCPSGSSSNPNNLLFHGTAAHGEAESRALLQAAALAPVSRLRLGIDIHSFSRVFFSSNTARSRLNAVQSDLLGVLRGHHRAVPVSGGVNGADYQDITDPPNSGIGAAAEYFAYQWLVPAWTLELEPQNGSREYGGAGVSHDGFILPASEIRRVREAWAETHLIAFYYMAGAPHLARVRIADADSGRLLQERSWHYDPSTQRRELQVSSPGVISAGQRLRILLSFNKPMRHRVAGEISQLPGRQVELVPQVALLRDDGEGALLDTATGRWTGSDGLRYRDDSFEFEATVPAGVGDFSLAVLAQDMVGLYTDGDPETPVDWSAGDWSAWDDQFGDPGATGGADFRTARVNVAGEAGGVELLAMPSVAGEGDLLHLRLRRAQPSASETVVIGESPESWLFRQTASPPPPPAPEIRWAAGETGEKLLPIRLSDDVDVQGERSFEISLSDLRDGGPQLLAQFDVRVLDNDRPGRPVLRPAAHPLSFVAAASLPAEAPLELVLDGDRSYRLDRPATAAARLTVERPLTIHGNRATLYPSLDPQGGCSEPALIDVAAGAELRLVGVVVRGDPARDRCGIRNRGVLRLERSEVAELDPEGGYSIDSSGELQIRRSRITRSGSSAALGSLRVEAGSADIAGSLIAAPNSAVLAAGGDSIAIRIGSDDVRISQSTVAGYPAIVADGDVQARIAGSVLFERLDTSIATPPPFTREACEHPVVLGEGGNLYAARYAGGDAGSLAASGCIAAAAGERFVGEDFAGLQSFGAVDPTPPAGSAAADSHAAPSCDGTDLHGRPRPQAAAAPARCDSGAVEQGVNPYRGIWNGARDGHGIDIETLGNTLFVLWYTYDDAGEPTAYHAAAALAGRQWEAALKQTRRDPQSGELSEHEVGRIGLDFVSNTEAQLSWRFDARGVDGYETVTAFVFAAGEPRFEVTGHWYPPSDSGYGASVFRRGEVTAALLYYYDAEGTMRWVLGSGSAADAIELEMSSFTGFCPDCDAAQMPLQSQPAGRLRMHFLTPERASVDSDIRYPGPAGGRWVRSHADFAPLSDPVDNRDPLDTSPVRQAAR